MKITLRREDLARELALLQGIVERRTTIPILSHVLIRTGESVIDLAATDLDVSLSTSCPADISGQGGIAIQAKKFSEIVRALAAEEIELEEEESYSLTIRGGRSRFRIRGRDPENFPTLPVVDGAEPVDLPIEVLREMIGKVLFAVSAEDSRFQLNGALLKMKPESVELAATDGYRLAVVERPLAGQAEDDGVLVPRKALQELQRFDGEGTVSYRRGSHHLGFALGARHLVCRILEGTFPDYERVISRDLNQKAHLDRVGLLAAVQRVALLTGERGRAVRLTFGEGRLQINAANPDLGDAQERVTCELEGEGLEIGLNPDYLSQFLAAVDEEQVRLDLKDGDSQCVGRPIAGEDDEGRYLYVIMPMRV